MPVTKVKPALGMTPPVNQVTAAQRSSGHYCPTAITPHTMNNLNIKMATSLLKNMPLSYGFRRVTERVWPSIEILASILSPGLTLFRTLVSSRSLRRNSLPARSIMI